MDTKLIQVEYDVNQESINMKSSNKYTTTKVKGLKDSSVEEIN